MLAIIPSLQALVGSPALSGSLVAIVSRQVNVRSRGLEGSVRIVGFPTSMRKPYSLISFIFPASFQ